MNARIAIEGMVIDPGDLILGDDDGLLCVPYDDTEIVYQSTIAKQASEEKIMAATRAGNVDRTWVEDALKKLGCEFT